MRRDIREYYVLIWYYRRDKYCGKKRCLGVTKYKCVYCGRQPNRDETLNGLNFSWRNEKCCKRCKSKKFDKNNIRVKRKNEYNYIINNVEDDER